MTSHPIPAAPPLALLAAVDAAAVRARDMAAAGRELRFTPRPGRRMLVELCGADGAVLRTLTPSEAIDVATGAAVA